MSDTPSILDRISDEMKAAMKAKDKVRLRTLRSLRSALQNKQIEQSEGGERAALSESDQLAVVRKQVKQRKDSIEQYDDAGRQDLVDKEQEELEILEEYLPQPMTDEELQERLEAVINDVDASSMADMGPVMGRAMSELRGTVDGSRVQEMVKELLG